ncbi:hypothetical protein HanHA300_Chr02g0068291 [Helianthus annuus]|nr:hypothetical protein HanHA300_Chr02g0068291 [Helianthus annuus]KAJ0616805.1 hypothetical protein HanIR_Chr02g0094581 [Helianthus annuus]KAJ0619909.1 hypothetical protein HanHA89_Chr02g0076531 [Helianthus annuus]
MDKDGTILKFDLDCHNLTNIWTKLGINSIFNINLKCSYIHCDKYLFYILRYMITHTL